MKELKEIAVNYAAGKTNEVMDNAIAQAYADGYRDGYNDRDAEIPVDLRGNKTEYIDLGLPSGTLWAKDYEHDDEILFLSYSKADQLSIPSEEQWEELNNFCRHEYEVDGAYNYVKATLIGPNGNILEFDRTDIIIANKKSSSWGGGAFIWILDKDEREDNEKKCGHLYNKGYVTNPNYRKKEGRAEITRKFSGYKLPIRLVRKK